MTLVAGGTTICTVLILVLVEDGLGELTCYTPTLSTRCLNPCFSGGWSRRFTKSAVIVDDECGLNPCFSGGWSRSRESWWSKRKGNCQS